MTNRLDIGDNLHVLREHIADASVDLINQAEIGLFVTLANPGKPMTTEAAKEGFYTSPITGAEFLRIQILTIAGLLGGRERVRFRGLSAGGHTFKKAKLDHGKSDYTKLFHCSSPCVPSSAAARHLLPEGEGIARA